MPQQADCSINNAGMQRLTTLYSTRHCTEEHTHEMKNENIKALLKCCFNCSWSGLCLCVWLGFRAIVTSRVLREWFGWLSLCRFFRVAARALITTQQFHDSRLNDDNDDVCFMFILMLSRPLMLTNLWFYNSKTLCHVILMLYCIMFMDILW